MKEPEFERNIQKYVHELMEWQVITKVDYKILTAKIRDAWRTHDKWRDKMMDVGKPVNFDKQDQNNVMTGKEEDVKQKKSDQNPNGSLKTKKLKAIGLKSEGGEKNVVQKKDTRKGRKNTNDRREEDSNEEYGEYQEVRNVVKGKEELEKRDVSSDKCKRRGKTNNWREEQSTEDTKEDMGMGVTGKEFKKEDGYEKQLNKDDAADRVKKKEGEENKERVPTRKEARIEGNKEDNKEDRPTHKEKHKKHREENYKNSKKYYATKHRGERVSKIQRTMEDSIEKKDNQRRTWRTKRLQTCRRTQRSVERKGGTRKTRRSGKVSRKWVQGVKSYQRDTMIREKLDATD